MIIKYTIPLIMTFSLFANAADIDAGEQAYAMYGCSGCHGGMGYADQPTIPNLAGQNAEYTVKQLKYFASGERPDPTMQSMARMVVGKEADIAAFLQSLN
jgi:cytochrome c553